MTSHNKSLPPTGRYRYSGNTPLDPIDVEVEDNSTSASEGGNNIASDSALALVEYLETNGSTGADPPELHLLGRCSRWRPKRVSPCPRALSVTRSLSISALRKSMSCSRNYL